ncbi:FadR/GntR family transcriptional regulator [Rhodococcoides yunnanense]|uniref:FadR/GntR family transcriptional regulator n=1 Tax=Rhodococcoides yunnanense TaxID=278209 RepID=UPI0009355621|nr:FadR/GntR family transcriptional regulator [Rhodococcus yunnanensis]
MSKPNGHPGIPPQVPRMADLVAAQLRKRIIGGDLKDGDELPREADLVEEFSVSRPSLREAVRILETEGLLRIRRGKLGGAFVKVPTPESAAYHLGLTLQSRGTTLADIAAAREILEPTCAGMVAGLKGTARKAALERLTKLVEDNDNIVGEAYEFTACALEFHDAIVDLCGNTSISIVTSALESVWSSQERQWAVRRTARGDYPIAKYQRDVIKAHRRVVSLIAEGDVAGASQAMREHLHKSQPYVGDQDAPIEVLENYL